MITALSREVVSDTARGEPLGFHPRVSAVPRSAGSLLVMTAQSVSGSDMFGSVYWMTSTDGRGHLERGAAGAFRRSLPNRLEDVVCDAVPGR